MNLYQHTLSNGIRLVHMQVPNMVAQCGLIINTGSRDESAEEQGMAHFIEHMLFKGTTRRKAYHILSRLEDRGGELNAYTTKEETAIHASFLKEDYSIAFEIISDILLNSTFPVKEIKKEKEVVMEEINSYKDSPSELIFDDFEEMVYRDAPIGRNILGTPETINTFNQNSIVRFIKNKYFTNQMVLCSVGNISENRIKKLFETHYGIFPEQNGENIRVPFNEYRPDSMVVEKGTWQNHCIIGNVAYDIRDERRIGMYLLNNILGGQGLNSRLNMSLREKNGFAYNIESSYHPYYDTGIFLIYFGTERENLNKSISLAGKELKRLMEVKMGTIQLHKAKQQIRGNLARSFENHESHMLGIGKSLLVYNKIDPIEVIYDKIENITSSELMEIANEIFTPDQLSTLVYK